MAKLLEELKKLDELKKLNETIKQEMKKDEKQTEGDTSDKSENSNSTFEGDEKLTEKAIEPVEKPVINTETDGNESTSGEEEKLQENPKSDSGHDQSEL